MRVCSWLILGGVGMSSLVGCASHKKVDPFVAAGLTRPSVEEARANANNEVWKVSELSFHDTSSGGYWTFVFSPTSPNNPDYTASVGRVSATDLVAQTEVETQRSPVGDGKTIIIVRRGSISEEMPSIEFPSPSPKSTRPGPDTQGAPQSPAISTGRTPVSPI